MHRGASSHNLRRLREVKSLSKVTQPVGRDMDSSVGCPAPPVRRGDLDAGSQDQEGLFQFLLVPVLSMDEIGALHISSCPLSAAFPGPCP